MKEFPNHEPQKSDVGQLLFYMFGIIMKSSLSHDQYQLGLFFEGTQVNYSSVCVFMNYLFQVLLCYANTTSTNSNEVEVDLKVSQFYDLLDLNTLNLICDAIFAVTSVVLENK